MSTEVLRAQSLDDRKPFAFPIPRCDLGGALSCDARYIALIWGKPACCAGLCEAKMLSGEACEA
jgi:hypothetical protein